MFSCIWKNNWDGWNRWLSAIAGKAALLTTHRNFVSAINYSKQAYHNKDSDLTARVAEKVGSGDEGVGNTVVGKLAGNTRSDMSADNNRVDTSVDRPAGKLAGKLVGSTRVGTLAGRPAGKLVGSNRFDTLAGKQVAGNMIWPGNSDHGKVVLRLFQFERRKRRRSQSLPSMKNVTSESPKKVNKVANLAQLE